VSLPVYLCGTCICVCGCALYTSWPTPSRTFLRFYVPPATPTRNINPKPPAGVSTELVWIEKGNPEQWRARKRRLVGEEWDKRQPLTTTLLAVILLAQTRQVFGVSPDPSLCLCAIASRECTPIVVARFSTRASRANVSNGLTRTISISRCRVEVAHRGGETSVYRWGQTFEVSSNWVVF